MKFNPTKFRLARVSARLGRAELAAKAHKLVPSRSKVSITKRTIEYLEQGPRGGFLDEITVFRLRYLAKALGCTPEDFQTDDGWKPSYEEQYLLDEHNWHSARGQHKPPSWVNG